MRHQTTEEQHNSEWLKTLSSCCGVGLWDALLHDGDAMHAKTRWTWSGEFRRLLGFDSEAEFPNAVQSWSPRLHPDDLGPTLRAFNATCATGVGFDVTYRLRVRAGTYRWFRATGGAILDDNGRARRACGSLTDIHDVVEAEIVRRRHDAAVREGELVRRSEQRLSVLIQNLSDVILIVDQGLGILYQSPTVETVWGYAPAALTGRPIAALVHPADRLALAGLWQRLHDLPGVTRNLELRLRPRGGAWRHAELVMTNLIHEPSIRGIVVTARDIEQRKTYEQRLTRQAFYDDLTSLPNRALCQDRLAQVLDGSDRKVTILIIDLDGFKLVNDGLGHLAGDQLLIEAAARLLAVCEPDDMVARPSGDEFVIILDRLPDETAALAFAEIVNRAFEQSFVLDGHSLTVTASIGIAVGDARQCSADLLLHNADVAMFRAKSDGKGRALLFDTGMERDSLSRLELEAELRRALEREELCVHYQPIVELKSGRLLGFEALVRWDHPQRGLLPPTAFIPLAEETGLIVPLGQWVLEQACRQAARWQTARAPGPPLTLSVNLSPRQFQQPSLDLQISRALQRSGLDPMCLKLEITESVIMSDVERTIPMLQKLKAIGVKLALDDFGTGYSSLAYLKRLPLDVLKIDRSFVTGIEQSQDDLAIVRAIISLAQSLRLSITAEGIETAAQAEILTALSCDCGQGYLFSRPVAAAAATRMIGAESRPAPRAIPVVGIRAGRPCDQEHAVEAA